MLRQPRVWASRASLAQKLQGLRVVCSKNFSRATFFVWRTNVVDRFLSYLPVKQIWRKSASCLLCWIDLNRFIGRLDRAAFTVHLISAQNRQEGIECTKTKEYPWAYCPNIYTVQTGWRLVRCISASNIQVWWQSFSTNSTSKTQWKWTELPSHSIKKWFRGKVNYLKKWNLNAFMPI